MQSQGSAAGAADTIVAIATPPGRGGIGVVRLSGPSVPALARALLGAVPPPRSAVARRFRAADGSAIDSGIALYFEAPASFTGEHVLELQGHGGPAVMDLLVLRALALGARAARPGEFSSRAFHNGKLDLAQAEAVADLIDAGSAAAARAALRSLQGEFSARVRALDAQLVALRMLVEAAIDFSEEDLDLPGAGGFASRLAALDGAFVALARGAEQGRLLHDGCTVVIAGRPNAGKSSLMNALAGYDAAIVAALPGTTRDLLRERIHIDGLPVTLLDTAGLRAQADAVEAEGMRRARRAIEAADRVLYLVDGTDIEALAAWPDEIAGLGATVPVTLLFNKTDLIATPRGAAAPAATGPGSAGTFAADALHVSALTGAGLDALRAHIRAAAGYLPGDSDTFSARRRHLDALGRARSHAASAGELLAARTSVELIAEELRLAQRALGEITGEFTSEDLLGRIFASFCIGK